MKRLLSTALAVTLLLGLGALAVLARGGGDILSPADNVVSAAVQPQTAAAPDAPAIGGKYNAVAIPLIVSGINDAASLKSYIETNVPGVTVAQLLKWDAAILPTGDYRIYTGSSFSDNFDVDTGDAIFVLAEGSTPTVLSFVGDVPAEGSVSFSLVGDSAACRYNFISVPLNKGSITDAAGLRSAIGGSAISDVAQVLSWDESIAPNGDFRIYTGSSFSDNFPVKIGYPYFVCMLASKPWN
jgi:hypothetical protein